MNYKGFEITKIKNQWGIYNNNGQLLKTCKTQKECKQRIDNQTI